MAKALSVDDQVFVPRTRLGISEDAPSVLHQTRVVEVGERSVKVNLPGGEISDFVASSLVHRNVGIQLIRIGDFETETSLLDPLAKSLLQFCRLLFPDDMVVAHQLRSHAELSKIWHANHGVSSHVVIVGHGSKAGLKFGVDGWVDVPTLVEAFDTPGVGSKTFITLACETGYKKFGGELSETTSVCGSVIAPFHSFHGAVASQYCQTFLAYRFLQGMTTKVAFKRARSAVPGAVSFRLWQKGKLVAGTK